MKKKDIQMLLANNYVGEIKNKGDTNLKYIIYPKAIIDAILKDYKK